jgi:hypothetical protein
MKNKNSWKKQLKNDDAIHETSTVITFTDAVDKFLKNPKDLFVMSNYTIDNKHHEIKYDDDYPMTDYCRYDFSTGNGLDFLVDFNFNLDRIKPYGKYYAIMNAYTKLVEFLKEEYIDVLTSLKQKSDKWLEDNENNIVTYDNSFLILRFPRLGNSYGLFYDIDSLDNLNKIMGFLNAYNADLVKGTFGSFNKAAKILLNSVSPNIKFLTKAAIYDMYIFSLYSEKYHWHLSETWFKVPLVANNIEDDPFFRHRKTDETVSCEEVSSEITNCILLYSSIFGSYSSFKELYRIYLNEFCREFISGITRKLLLPPGEVGSDSIENDDSEADNNGVDNANHTSHITLNSIPGFSLPAKIRIISTEIYDSNIEELASFLKKYKCDEDLITAIRLKSALS